MSRKLIIATRESPLALWQAEFVRSALTQAYPDVDVQLLGMTSRGDQLLDVPLAKVGGKGLFVKELEERVLNSSITVQEKSIIELSKVTIPSNFEIITTYRVNSTLIKVSYKGDLEASYIHPKFAHLETIS